MRQTKTFRRRSSFNIDYLMAGLLALPTSPVNAAEACVDVRLSWSCFGEIQFETLGPDAALLRWTRYTNDEMMLERVAKDRLDKALLAKPSSVQFMTGSNTQTGAASTNNPFATAALEYGLIFTVLQQVQPNGPQSVGATAIEGSTKILGNVTLSVTLRRLSATKIGFEIVRGDDQKKSMRGHVVQPLAAPLPDTMSLDGWRADGRTAATLADARKLAPPLGPARSPGSAEDREKNARQLGAELREELQRASGDKELEKFAGSIAQAMVEKRDDYIYENFHPRIRADIEPERNQSALREMRGTYGDVIGFELRQKTVGIKTGIGDPIKIVTYWYAVNTSLAADNRFMKIEVAREGDRPSLASVAILEFAAGNVPPWMR